MLSKHAEEPLINITLENVTSLFLEAQENGTKDKNFSKEIYMQHFYSSEHTPRKNAEITPAR